MSKVALTLVLLLVTFTSMAASPDDSLRVLLANRAQLVEQYQFYNAQNSNFWGKKSKKDLLHIIDTLKEIIRKDSEIINTIKTTTLRRAAEATVQKSRLEEQVKDDRVIVTDNLYELKSQLANLQNLQKVRQNKLNELQEELSHLHQRKTNRDLIIGLSGLIIVGLLMYIRNLRRKLSPKKR